MIIFFWMAAEAVAGTVWKCACVRVCVCVPMLDLDKFMLLLILFFSFYYYYFLRITCVLCIQHLWTWLIIQHFRLINFRIKITFSCGKSEIIYWLTAQLLIFAEQSGPSRGRGCVFVLSYNDGQQNRARSTHDTPYRSHAPVWLKCCGWDYINYLFFFFFLNFYNAIMIGMVNSSSSSSKPASTPTITRYNQLLFIQLMNLMNGC